MDAISTGNIVLKTVIDIIIYLNVPRRVFISLNYQVYSNLKKSKR